MGVFYAIGDVKDGRRYGRIFRELAGFTVADVRHILYIGAAINNDLKYKAQFERGARISYQGAQISSLNLSPHTPLTDRHARPEKIETRFAEADIVYFDGGSIHALLTTLTRFGLIEQCRAVFDRGGAVGGLCGGGTVLASLLVHAGQADIRCEAGAGLMPGLIMTSKINIEGERAERLRQMRVALRDNPGHSAIALGRDQAVIWRNRYEGARALMHSKRSPKEKRPFQLSADGTQTPLPLLVP